MLCFVFSIHDYDTFVKRLSESLQITSDKCFFVPVCQSDQAADSNLKRIKVDEVTSTISQTTADLFSRT